jgi:hypothetical protein
MIFKHLLPAACLSLAPVAATAQEPDAARIIEGARISATLTVLDGPLNGTLSKSGKRTPIALFLQGQNIQFQFSEKGDAWRVFHMRLADERYDLFEIINGKTVRFPAAKLVEPIAGTDLTYEDLAFRFFYWPNPKFEGREKVAGQDCYKIRLDKPRGAAGRYEAVYVWVHTKYGAFMRIRGHGPGGALLKEFQVEDVMQVAKDVWTLRKMQVATHDPKTGRRQSLTSVTFDTPKKTAVRGPR